MCAIPEIKENIVVEDNKDSTEGADNSEETEYTLTEMSKEGE